MESFHGKIQVKLEHVSSDCTPMYLGPYSVCQREGCWDQDDADMISDSEVRAPILGLGDWETDRNR